MGRLEDKAEGIYNFKGTCRGGREMKDRYVGIPCYLGKSCEYFSDQKEKKFLEIIL